MPHRASKTFLESTNTKSHKGIAKSRPKLLGHFNRTQSRTKICTSKRSTNAKAAPLQRTFRALASVLLSNGRLLHCV